MKKEVMAMFKLYDKQLQVANECEEMMFNDKDLSKGKVYLSGEMGSGKTYMGSHLANKLSESYPVLVVSPQININKWADLLDNPTRLKRSTRLDGTMEGISLVSFENLNMWSKEQKPFDKPLFLIIDEVHLAVNSRFEAYERVMNELLPKHSKCLFLTGTIMEGERKKIADIINVSHPHFENLLPTSIQNLLLSDFPRFIFKVWQHVSTSISLEDVQALSDNREDIKQEIAPINSIPLSTEQSLLAEVVKSQLRQVNIDRKRLNALTTSFIDNPQKPLVHKTITRTSKEKMKDGNLVRLGIPLKELDFKSTSKYQKLKDIVENSNDDRILVYANEVELIEKLSQHLNEDGINTFTIENVKPEDYSEYINQKFTENKVGVVNPEKVNVGVDIHAEQLVWYQLMPILDKMIQAQRRVCRLSSQYKSLVTLMVYDTPFEEERANELSNASKNNAITYGVKQEDELAQLTGILLEGIN